VRIPFWDWTVDRTPSDPPWLADFLGGDGGPSNPRASQSGEVANGRFAHATGAWNITHGDPGTNDDPFDRAYLARGFGRRADATTLPTVGQQDTALGRDFYSQLGFDLEVVLHNRVHRWVTGQMINRGSPHDPVFWLHHCTMTGCGASGCAAVRTPSAYTAPANVPSFHQRTGTMIFHDPAIGPATPTWPGSFRPVDTIADHALGVWYEGDPPIVSLQTPSQHAAPEILRVPPLARRAPRARRAADQRRLRRLLRRPLLGADARDVRARRGEHRLDAWDRRRRRRREEHGDRAADRCPVGSRAARRGRVGAR
jgi:tyrosinase-like protein